MGIEATKCIICIREGRLHNCPHERRFSVTLKDGSEATLTGDPGMSKETKTALTDALEQLKDHFSNPNTCPKCHGAKRMQVIVPKHFTRLNYDLTGNFECAVCGGSGRKG